MSIIIFNIILFLLSLLIEIFSGYFTFWENLTSGGHSVNSTCKVYKTNIYIENFILENNCLKCGAQPKYHIITVINLHKLTD